MDCPSVSSDTYRHGKTNGNKVAAHTALLTYNFMSQREDNATLTALRFFAPPQISTVHMKDRTRRPRWRPPRAGSDLQPKTPIAWVMLLQRR